MCTPCALPRQQWAYSTEQQQHQGCCCIPLDSCLLADKVIAAQALRSTGSKRRANAAAATAATADPQVLAHTPCPDTSTNPTASNSCANMAR